MIIFKRTIIINGQVKIEPISRLFSTYQKAKDSIMEHLYLRCDFDNFKLDNELDIKDEMYRLEASWNDCYGNRITEKFIITKEYVY